MQRKLILLGLLLAISGCIGSQQYLGMMNEEGSSELSETKAKKARLSKEAAAETWFESYVEAVDHAETWQEITQVLDQGSEYLDQFVEWDDDLYTPLHYAAEEGDLAVVKELIQRRNVSVNMRTGRYDRTPLHLASSGGHLETVKYLIEKNADVSLKDTAGSDALHYAALGVQKKLNTAVARYLIEQKNLDPSLRLGGKYNLLFLAIETYNMSLVKYIMEKYPEMANDRADDMSPVEFARAKHQEAMAILIEQKKST